MEYESEKAPSNYVLSKAVDKLDKYGQDVFDMYCDENDISFCDRNRCIAKCKMINNRDDLQEMACPDQLRGARWDHYTKVLGYHPKKARELLYAIDSSYGDQFTPRLNAGALVSNIG